MSTLDCDSTTRLNTSRTWDGRTDSKNSDTSSELLPGTLVQATEQPKHHANPTTTVQPLARRLSQRRQHYLSPFQHQSQPTIGQSPQPFQLKYLLSSHEIWKAGSSPCTILRDRCTVETDSHLLPTSSMDVHLTTTLLVVPCVKLTRVHKAWLTQSSYNTSHNLRIFDKAHRCPS